MYNYKTYIKNYFLYLLILFILLMSFVLLVDPYCEFNIVSIDRFNKIKTRQYSDKSNWIKATKKIILTNKYETIFLGSSRVLKGLNPDFLPESYKGYNAAYSSANFYDFENFKKEIEKSNIKRIVWGIDFCDGCLDDSVKSHRNNILSGLQLESIISSQTLYDSIVTILDNLFLLKHGILKDNNGFLVTKEKKYENNYAAIFNNVENGFKRKIHRIKRIDYYLTLQREFSFVEWLVRISKEKNMDIYIYISPVHINLLNIIIDGYQFETYKSWVELLSKTIYETDLHQNNKNDNVFELWDFSGYNSITKEAIPTIKNNFPMKWYIDPSHYRETVGNMILEKIFDFGKLEVPLDFGVKLNPNNINRHLELMYLSAEGAQNSVSAL